MTIQQLENKYNSHPRESSRLLELCNGNIDELSHLYYIMKLKFTCKVPNNRQEVEILLNTSLKIQHINGSIGYLKPIYDTINNCYTSYGSKKEEAYATIWPSSLNKGPLLYFWQSRSNFKLI